MEVSIMEVSKTSIALALTLTIDVALFYSTCVYAGPASPDSVSSAAAKPLAKSCSTVQPTSGATDMQAAITCFNKREYSAAREMFERLVQAQPRPDATLYYYTAVSNQHTGNIPRAKQLYLYVVQYFPNTEEATFSKQCLSSMNEGQSPVASNSSTATPSSSESELPESVIRALPPALLPLLNTEAKMADPG